MLVDIARRRKGKNKERIEWARRGEGEKQGEKMNVSAIWQRAEATTTLQVPVLVKRLSSPSSLGEKRHSKDGHQGPSVPFFGCFLALTSPNPSHVINPLGND